MSYTPIHNRNPPWAPPKNAAEVFDHAAMITFFASWIKPEVYLEYGVSTGLVLNNVAPYCKRAIGVDLNNFPTNSSNIEKHIMSTREFGRNLASSGIKKIDMAFIDADHRYLESFQDFQDIYPLLSENGFIFLHDTYPTISKLTEDIFCSDSWKTPFLIRKHFANECDILTIPICPGLTIVRKRLNLEWMREENIVDPKEIPSDH
jgi:hypothetical protein